MAMSGEPSSVQIFSYFSAEARERLPRIWVMQKRPPHGARHGADARIHEELRQVLLHGLARWRLPGCPCWQ